MWRVNGFYLTSRGTVGFNGTHESLNPDRRRPSNRLLLWLVFYVRARSD
jgi:hypothetical protein